MSVFYSFHYDRDSWRVQQVMNMGVIDGSPLLNHQEWETVKRGGGQAIKNWIDRQMLYGLTGRCFTRVPLSFLSDTKPPTGPGSDTRSKRHTVKGNPFSASESTG